MVKENQRAAKTQAKIEAALVDLCQKQVPFETLTVPKLAQAAGISRQTFYRHYLSPKQVIIEMIDRHLQEFLREFRLQNLTAKSMIAQLLGIWETRQTVFQLVEWADTRIEFIKALSAFDLKIAAQNQIHLIDGQAICNVYAAATYMFLRDYVLQRRWTLDQATGLLLHLTNNMDQIFP